MPAKRRRKKGRVTVSDRARAIYRNRPNVIEGNVILDEELADELLDKIKGLAGVKRWLRTYRD